MDQVTGDQVRDAMIAANITRVDNHQCGLCGFMVYFFREGDSLYFNQGCDCAWIPAEPRSWDDAAAWINMQSSVEARDRLRKMFGLMKDGANGPQLP